MPFDTTFAEKGSGTVALSEFDKPDPRFLDTLGAALRQENLVGSYLASPRRSVADFNRVEPGYDVFGDVAGYEDHLDRFEEIYNPEAAAAVKAAIDKEKQDRQTLAASGWTGVGLQMGAAIVDPTLLLPGGVMVKAGRLGYRVGRTAASVAGAAAVATAVQEAGLQSTQEIRPLGESALAIGGSTLLGGLVGAGAAKFFSKAEWDAFGKSLKEDLAADVPNPDKLVETIVQRAQSAGAANVDQLNLDDLGVGGPRIAQAVARATAAARINPGIQTMLSPSKAVRETYTRLVDNPIYSKMNMEGATLGPDVENLVKMHQRGALASWLDETRKIYKEARKDGYTGTRSEFYEAVARAGRRGDQDPTNPYVTRAAQSTRAKIFDPLLQRAQETGQIPADVKPETAPTYVTRLWSRTRLVAEEKRFRDIARKYFAGEIEALQAKIEDIKLGNKIVDSDRAAARFDQASARSQGFDERLAERMDIRGRKVGALEGLRRTRGDVMKQRAPKPLVEVLRGAKEDETIIATIREARAAARSANKKQSYGERFPVLSIIRNRGGVRVGSVLDNNLRAMGVTPKTHPGLFNSRSGMGDVDNLVKSEYPVFTDVADDGAGYVDPRAVMESIRDELAGNPLRTPDEMAAADMAEQLDRIASEWLQAVGLPEDAKVKDVRAFIARVLGAEEDLGAFDARISKLEKEIEDFDAKTDGLRNEREISAQEARTIADELNALEAEIAEVADFANSSPRVSLVVDYAKVKRDLFRAKLEERNLTKRLDAIKALDKSGKANDDMLAELAAKSVDASRLDVKIKGLMAKADKLKPMVPKVRQELPEFVSGADRADYIEEIVSAVFNNLTGKGAGDVPEWIVPVARGPLKERTFRIPDEAVEDFLENDMELIARRYTRIMGAETELAAKFGRADMRDQFDAIAKDYEQLRAAAKTAKELESLTAAERRDVTNLAAFRDMIRGTYRAAEESSSWSKISRGALAWNYMRLLGGVTLTSITDAARLLGVHGVRATMREALPALVSNVKAAKLARTEARDLGVVTETVLQSRLASLADLNEPYAAGSKFDRYLSNATNVFTKATGLSWWNDTVKMMASVMTQNRILRNAAVGDYAKLDSYERSYMAYLGIDETMAQRIAAQFQRYGETEKGINAANANAWDDELARRTWAAALSKDVDRTIVTKGVADAPLWMKTNWGKLLMQFKSFGLAAHQRVLIAGLQERPHRFMEQLVFATTVGMMVGYLKMIERGDFDRAQQLVDNPGGWIADGVDRTGLFFLLTEPLNTIDKGLSSYNGQHVGTSAIGSALAGDEGSVDGATRFANRNAMGAFAGPSAGLFEDLWKILAAVSKGDLNKGSANALLRQIPGGTLPGARTAIHVGIKPALVEATE